MYRHPGVYIEEIPSGVLAIEAASTSTAAIVGPVSRGEVGEPELVTSAAEYARKFGDLRDPTGSVLDLGDAPDFFGFAVNGFFANGGSKAYVVRVAEGVGDQDLGTAETVLPHPTDSTKAFEISAKSPGSWANPLIVRLTTTDDSQSPDLTLGYTLSIGIDSDDFEVLESFSGLGLTPGHPLPLAKAVSDGSSLVTIAEKAVSGNTPPVRAKALVSGIINVDDLELLGKTLKVSIGPGSGGVDITFEENTADLRRVAAAIQAAVRADEDKGSEDFVVRVAEQSLVLISGKLGAAGQVKVPSGTAQAMLSLGSGDGVAIDYPSAALSSGTDMFEAFLSGGADGVAKPGTSKYEDAFTKLRDYRDVSIVLLPGRAWPSNGTRDGVIDAAIAHAEFMKNRMVVVDPPDPSASATSAIRSSKNVKDLALPTSTYCALYYPWLEVANPHYNPDTAASRPKTFRVPPSAHAAGLWARIDGTRGVWKAPAGLEATVRGAQGPSLLVGNDIQDQLNEWGINCIRPIIGPSVIWGARTLATKVKPDHRYVPVRRTSIMIGESLYNALQAVVFEPNDHRLWASLRASVGNFLDGLHRAGAFQGAKASDAYFVRCGLGSSMTQGDIDAGIVRVVVGFAPLKPAEFVVVQIQQIVGQSAA